MKLGIIRKISFTIIVAIILFALNVQNISAQKALNEFSIYGSGGVAAFLSQPKLKGNSSIGYCGDAGIGFTGFFSSNWGILTGAGFGFFNAKNKANSLLFILPNQKDCGYFYDLHTTLTDYSEIHKSFFVSIPLMLQYQTKLNQSLFWKKDNKIGFYLMAGMKAVFLFHYHFESELASYNNAAYYPEFNNWIYTLPMLGLGTFNGYTNNVKLGFGVMAMVALETGMKYRVGKNSFLYTGIFFDYGLNDPTKKYRLLNNHNLSKQPKETAPLDFAYHINLMEIGAKLRLSFFWKKTALPCPY